MSNESRGAPAVVVERPAGDGIASSRFSRASVSPVSTPPSRRVASPMGIRSAVLQEPASPPEGSERASQHSQEVGLFERDVEFSSDHLLTPHEAVDVAIPPVLAEAAEALATEPLPTVLAKVASSASIAGVLRGHDGDPSPTPHLAADGFAPLHLPQGVPHQPGWQSPSMTYALEQAERAGSPSSSSAADFDSPGPNDRIYTPATSPSPPLLEAKLAATHVSEPPPVTSSPLSSAPGSPRSLSPAPAVVTSMPFPTSGSTLLSSGPSSPTQTRSLSQSMAEGRDRRRLSFMSYADLINMERGNPVPIEPSLELGALASALVVDDPLDGKDDDELTISRARQRSPSSGLRRGSVPS